MPVAWDVGLWPDFGDLVLREWVLAFSCLAAAVVLRPEAFVGALVFVFAGAFIVAALATAADFLLEILSAALVRLVAAFALAACLAGAFGAVFRLRLLAAGCSVGLASLGLRLGVLSSGRMSSGVCCLAARLCSNVSSG